MQLKDGYRYETKGGDIITVKELKYSWKHKFLNFFYALPQPPKEFRGSNRYFYMENGRAPGISSSRPENIRNEIGP